MKLKAVLVAIAALLVTPAFALGSVNPEPGTVYTHKNFGDATLIVNYPNNSGFSLRFVSRCYMYGSVAIAEHGLIGKGTIKNGKLHYEGKVKNFDEGVGRAKISGRFKSQTKVVVKYHHEYKRCEDSGTYKLQPNGT